MSKAIDYVSDDIDELKVFIKEYIYFLKHSIKLRLAIWLAEIKQKARNKRYHVIIAVIKGRNGKMKEVLRSINRDDVANYKKLGWLPKSMDYLTLSRKSFYSTPINMNNSFSKEDRDKAMDKYLRYAKVTKSF